MRTSLRTHEHQVLIRLLRDQRRATKLTQQEVADRLGTPQSYVAKYEGAERRIDVLEFLAITRALDADPLTLFRALVGELDHAERERVARGGS